MNYTKGEWEVITKKRNEAQFFDHFTLGVQSDKLLIALCDREQWDEHKERLANAHLIAAAPLMHGQLETGITALTEALNHLNSKEIREATDYIKGVIAGNEMALAKAEGKENDGS